MLLNKPVLGCFDNTIWPTNSIPRTGFENFRCIANLIYLISIESYKNIVIYIIDKTFILIQYTGCSTKVSGAWQSLETIREGLPQLNDKKS